MRVLKAKPVFVPARSNQAREKYYVAAAQKLTPGKQTNTFDFAYHGGAMIARGLGASVPSTEVPCPY
jgi:hypothetical protein